MLDALWQEGSKMKKDGQSKPTVGGTLVFRIPYGGRARFDWHLDRFEHDVLVECASPWKGLKTDVHQIGMGPKFTPEKARQLAEVLARRIIENLEYVLRNRLKDDIELSSYYDNRQLPLYRKWAWEEEKRRMVEVAIVAEAYKDDDDDDDSPDNVLGADHIALAEAELAENNQVVLIEEIDFENTEGGAK